MVFEQELSLRRISAQDEKSSSTSMQLLKTAVLTGIEVRTQLRLFQNFLEQSSIRAFQ